MEVDKKLIAQHNSTLVAKHQQKLAVAAGEVGNANEIIEKLKAFQIAIPSWALGTGGTRFGRFSGGGGRLGCR